MERSYFDGGLLQLIGWRLLGTLITAFTLGIYGFWLSIKRKKWKTMHTEFA